MPYLHSRELSRYYTYTYLDSISNNTNARLAQLTKFNNHVLANLYVQLRFATIDEMEQVLRSNAARAQPLNPGAQYIVARWEPERKPAGQWTLPKPEFQISKTYCLKIVPGNPRLQCRSTLLEDHTFNDVVDRAPSRSFPKVDWEAIEDKEWRRGYFSNTRWDKQPPKRGEDNTMMKRFEEHRRRQIKAPDLERAWDRTARKQANKLLRRREKWSHMKKLAAAESGSGSSSSSTDSSDDVSDAS